MRRVGSLQETALNLKIISSVNREPRRAIQDEALRIDLFYRLAVIYIHIPPLRERGGDIEALAHHFMALLNRTLGKSVQYLSPEIMERFKTYDWPGNVRELQNTVEAAMNMVTDSDETISPKHLPAYFQNPPESITKTQIIETRRPPKRLEARASTLRPSSDPPGRSLTEGQSAREAELICQALSTCGGNVSRAARNLCISRQLLHYKMKKYGLDRKTFCKC